MERPIKSKLISVKNHVIRNRGKYAVAGTTLVFLWLTSYRVKEWTAFLEEKGIDPMEFFNPEYFEELKS